MIKIETTPAMLSELVADRLQCGNASAVLARIALGFHKHAETLLESDPYREILETLKADLEAIRSEVVEAENKL